MNYISVIIFQLLSVTGDGLPTPLNCNKLSATTEGLGSVQLTGEVQLTVNGENLHTIKELLGLNAVLAIDDCHFKATNPVFLPPKATELLSIGANLKKEAQSSNTMFDATRFAQAMGSSEHGRLFEIIDSSGKNRPAGIFFRKRLADLWEFYLLADALSLENTAEDQPVGSTVILEIGVLKFEDGAADVTSVEVWHPGNNDPNDRFFKQYTAEDPTALKAGEMAYDSAKKEGVIHWKDGKAIKDIEVDFGHFEGSITRLTQLAQSFRFDGIAQDGHVQRVAPTSLGVSFETMGPSFLNEIGWTNISKQ